MQKTFREMSETRGLWRGAEVATQQDLCGLFVTRVIQLYLKNGGSFGLVMPIAAIDRAQYEGFRSGNIPDIAEPIQLEFGASWDLRRLRPHFFPRAASVVFGHRSVEVRPMPADMMSWSGRLVKTNGTWEEVRDQIAVTSGSVKRPEATVRSPYAERFCNGATIFPRVLFVVERLENNPLGTPAGRVPVRSARSANEKKPWKEVDALEGVVESEFLRPVLLSECLLPSKLRGPLEAVIPWVSSGLMEADGEEIDLHPGLADWWRRASRCWEENRRNADLPLTGRLDYMSNLRKQFPIPEIRVIYNKSGMHVVAARSMDRRSVVENGLYWTGVASEEEADYLCAILNCPATTEVVRPFMSYGKDERDIAKQIWQLPILEFDSTNESHRLLARFGRDVRESIEALEIDEGLHFTAARRRIRRWLEDNEPMRQIGEIVFEILS